MKNSKKLDDLKNNLKLKFNEDPYRFEVSALDFWCLKNSHLSIERIFVTPRQHDLNIDGIIISSNKQGHQEVYAFQVSLASKSTKDIEKFINTNVSDEYSSIIPKYCTIKKVLITLDKSVYDAEDLEVLSSNELLNLVYKIGNEYSLLNGCILNEEYYENVILRTEEWYNFHNNNYDNILTKNLLLESLNVLFVQNYYSMKKQDFKLIKSIVNMYKHEINTFIDANFSNEREKYLATMKYLCRKAGIKYTTNIENLILFVGDTLGYSNPNFEIKPTRRYLSIKSPNKNVAYAHLDWDYNSSRNQNAFWGFKCDFRCLDIKDGRIKEMIKIPLKEIDSKTSSTKTYYKIILKNCSVKNYLKFVMNSALLNPNLNTDKELFKGLIYKSKEKVS